ncbi:hypothetical protein BDW22DRAFT_1425853 [Trametopsis cervina]|nr:hypothetical protein BDW22DRAFT_1425853 [Trametopsis cervina]
MSSTIYEGLLQKLATALEVLDESIVSSPPSTETKRKLVQATNAFKEDVARAKDLAHDLPGAELSSVEQEDIIVTLETLKVRKKAILSKFADEMNKKPEPIGDILSMDVDSTASTPAN